MSTAPDPSEKLLELERILASTSSVSAATGSGADLAATMIRSVLTERIKQTTSLLSQPHGDVDAADLVAMRLLLADYTTAVTNLRSAARQTEARLAGTAASLAADGRRVDRAVEEAMRAARRIEEPTAPPDGADLP